MSNNHQLRADNWERYGWVWTALGFAMPLIAIALALSEGDLRAATRTELVWLSLAYMLWYTLFVIWIARVDFYRRYPAVGLVYFVVALVLWFMLVDRSPTYYLLLFALYGQVFWFLPLRYAVGMMVVLSATMAYSQVDELPLAAIWRSSALWIMLLTSLSGILLGLWIHSIIRQSSGRRHLIEELQHAQAELASAERNAGILEERQRLARDIHDTLAQGFSSIVMQLEAAEQALNAGGTTSQVHEHVDRARQIARQNLSEARRVINDLRPASLEQATLPQALARTVRTWRQTSNVPAVLTISGDPLPLHPEIEVTLLRAVQEALTNVQKHAHADRVDVTLTYFPESVILDVQDDGVGLTVSPAAAPPGSGGFGLRAMRERVARLGGTLQLESDVGEGTTLAVEIPLLSVEKSE